jgi:cyclohexanone monooxygenase
MNDYYDAVVIGAGFSGIYALKKLRDELGLSVRVYEKGDGVGGTWHWNTFPGALSDSETHIYCYSHDKTLLKERDFSSKYITQPEIRDYLESVVDRWNLRQHIELSNGVMGAEFDEHAALWTVETESSDRVTAKYVITAIGVLSAPNLPRIPGIETFQGQLAHTAGLKSGAEYAGKRVGVIGTGSTGVQVISAVAPEAGHLTVFQRSAQYTVPIGNRLLSRSEVNEIKANYDEIWDQVMNSTVAFGFDESTVPYESVSPQEREAIFERAWQEGGGFRFMFATFSDIVTSEAANKGAQDFIKRKIAQIVDDPETARKLTPTDPYAKRPLCDSGYYATFNRPNVELVDVKANPIEKITPSGVLTADGTEHELDVLFLATGFDAVEGSFRAMNIRGRKGRTLTSHWQETGPKSFLGVSMPDFPNLFMILGPGCPFCNIPPAIETQVEWISDLIGYAERDGVVTVEATAEAEDAWRQTCETIASYTVFPNTPSWIFGSNIPGKTQGTVFFFAGLGAYRQKIAEEASNGYKNFNFSR